MTQLLLKLIEFDESYNVVHTLYGYTIASINISLEDRLAFDLKKKFSMLQELYLSRMLEKESICLIVVDALSTFRSGVGSINEKLGKIFEGIGFAAEETMINPKYLLEKWSN